MFSEQRKRLFESWKKAFGRYASNRTAAEKAIVRWEWTNGERYFLLEILFFLCLCFPFVLISFSITPNADLFFLFPLGFAILPFIGAFILYLELKLVKPEAKTDPVILALCAVDIFSGVIGWLMFLLMAVTKTFA